MSPASRPLVGREEDVARLVEALGLADPGGGPGPVHAAVVGGDAGIGKTRVVDELRGRAEDAGWHVVVGRCLDLGVDAVAWLPLTESLQRLLADDPAGLTAALTHRPGLAALLGGEGVVREPAGSLLEEAAGLLGDLAAERPLTWVVEDLHWADPSTLALLGLLLAREPASPLRVVATYRSDDLHRRHPLRAVLAGWARLPGVVRVGLGPLSPDEVATMARRLAGPGVEDADVATVVARADGNAFFVEELVAALGSPSGRTRAAGTLPEDLADLLLLRLEELSPPARSVVRAAAAATSGVGPDLLAAVCGLDADRVDAALREASERHVLVTDGEGVSFRHALLAEATYGDLLPGERTRLHGAFASALVASTGRRGPGAGAALARHARLAGERDLALAASVEAGDEAMAVSGPGEAAAHYERALELLAAGARADPPVDPTDLTARTAAALVDAGTVGRAAGLLIEALSEQPAPDARVRLELELLRTALAGEVGVDVHDLARDLRRRADDPVAGVDDALRADVLAAFALALRVTDSPAALEAAQEARLLAERQGRAGLVADVRMTIARIEETEPGASRRVLAQVVEQARADGDVLAELRGGYHLATVRLEAGEADAATDEFARVVARAVETNRTWAPYGLDARIVGVMAAYVAGRWDEGLALADPSPGPVPPVPRALLRGAALHVRAARGEDRRDHLAEVRRHQDADTYLGLLAGGAGIDLLAGAGDLAGAVALHDEALEVVERGWGAGAPARLRLGALLLAALAGTPSDPTVDHASVAGRILDGLRPVGEAERRRSQGPEGLTWFARAEAEALRVRVALGEDVDPAAHAGAWGRVVTSFDDLGHVWEAARSRARHATALHAAGRSAEAQDEARRAADVARRLGAVPLLRELGAPRGPAPAGGATETLTARELEVLRLVADGLSNGQVGSRLFISTKTVSVHVSRVLAKLGATGRTEAAALARRRGLLDG